MLLFCGIPISVSTSLALFPSYCHFDSDDSDSKSSLNKSFCSTNIIGCFDGGSVVSINEPLQQYATYIMK